MSHKMLFVIPLSAGMRNQVETAKVLQEAGIQPIFLSAESRARLDAFPPFHSTSFDGFAFHYLEDFEPVDTSMKPANADLDGGQSIAEKLDDRSRRVFEALRKTYELNLKRLVAALELLDPQALAVSDDAIACDPLITSAAQVCQIPIYCFPYGNGGPQDLENTVAHRNKDGTGYSVQSPGGSILADRFPKWIKSEAEAGSIFMRPEVILARESVGASIRNCWHLYGSEADKFFAISPHERDHLVQIGFEDSRIEVVGSATGALIASTLEQDGRARPAFRQPYPIVEGRMSVLVALPPSYHADRAEMTPFPGSYSELIEEVLRPFRDMPDVDLTISAHPATTKDDLSAYHRLGLQPSNEYIHTLIPRHDLFVTDFSSTIAWATACGKPVLNYDFYDFDLNLYDGVPGIMTVRDHSEYLALAEKLLGDKETWREAAEMQCSVAPDWGTIDNTFREKVSAILAKDTIQRRQLKQT